MKARRFVSMLLCICMMMGMVLPLEAAEVAPTEIVTQNIEEQQTTETFMVPVEQKTEVPEGYIGIYTADDLRKIGTDDQFPSKGMYILMNDIDLSEYNWEPIKYFTGVLNGNGFLIYNLCIDIDASTISPNENIGFIAYNQGKVCNIGFHNVNIAITMNDSYGIPKIGVIAGFTSDESNIYNCYTFGKINFSFLPCLFPYDDKRPFYSPVRFV